MKANFKLLKKLKWQMRRIKLNNENDEEKKEEKKCVSLKLLKQINI